MSQNEQLEAGEVIAGRYRIESQLGAGGFSTVYKASHLGFNRQVAVKVLRPNSQGPVADDVDLAEEMVERFRREAEVISQLRSPATVNVHDYGRTEAGHLYMVLEYVDGRTLFDIAQQYPLAPGRVAHVLEQILDSLGEAHHFGILHRDIKPANIMLFEHMGDSDTVKVLDFGVAKLMTDADSTVAELTRQGFLVGTPRYMAPELIKNTDPCPASDLYAVGLV